MDFLRENLKLAEELKFHRMTSLLLHFNLSPLDVNRHSFNQIDGQWLWMNGRLLRSVMNLNLILPPVHRRRETSAKGWKVFLSGSDPGWLGWLGAIGHQCEISDSGRRPRWARALSLRLRLGSQFLATLYLSLMGKLNIRPIKDGHVYLLLEAWERDWIPLKPKRTCSADNVLANQYLTHSWEICPILSHKTIWFANSVTSLLASQSIGETSWKLSGQLPVPRGPSIQLRAVKLTADQLKQLQSARTAARWELD